MKIEKTNCRHIVLKCIAVGAGILFLLTACGARGLKGRNTWVIILEQNFYPSGYSPLDVNFLGSQRIFNTLTALGVKEDHMYLGRNEVTQNGILKAFTWADERVKRADTLFVYIFSHGEYLTEYVSWEEWFPPLWGAVDAENKVLLVDACNAEKFITPLSTLEGDPGFLLASCETDELSWCGLEEEGLPILGSSWLAFLLESAMDPETDLDENGYISLLEMFSSAVGPLQDYMMNTVYADPEFLKGIHRYGIYPETMEGYPNPVLYSRDNRDLELYRVKRTWPIL